MGVYARGDSARLPEQLLFYETGGFPLRPLSFLALFAAAFLFGGGALADPSFWLWYPHQRPYQPYGNDVTLSNNGLWVHRDGEIHWVKEATDNAKILSPRNSDKRNGELAYAAAYSAYHAGARSGTNRVEQAKAGRWKKRITTARGIVLLTDSWNNVAVRDPNGKWHVTDGKGKYAASSVELPGDVGDPEMVAAVWYPPARKAAEPAPARVDVVTPASLDKPGNRMPASLATPEYAD